MNAALSDKQRKFSHFITGTNGELLACRFLAKKQFHIIGRNIRWKHYEADIVAQDLQTNQLVIIEVKTRKTKLVAAHHAFSKTKLRALHVFASNFVKLHYKYFNHYLDYRIDAVCIVQNKIEHFPNISWW